MGAISRIALALTAAGLVAVSVAGAVAQQERTQELIIELKTTAVSVPFEVPQLPGGMDIPGLHEMFAPQRELSAHARYRKKAVAPIYLTVPADLGLPRNRLVLQVPEPSDVEERPGHVDSEEPEDTGTLDLTTKLYWHPDTAEGPLTQDVSVNLSEFSRPDVASALARGMAQMAEELERTASGSANKFPATAVGSGRYALNTGGEAVLDGFLPAIKMLSPTKISEVKPEEGVALRWEPVPGARGFIVHATGMSGMLGEQQVIISWVSTLREPPERVRSGYEPETSIADDLHNGILLPGDTTSCTIPPGIFVDVDTFFVEVTAVGNDYYDDTDGIVVRGKIRSVWSATQMNRLPMGLPGFGVPGMEDRDQESEGEPGEEGDEW